MGSALEEMGFTSPTPVQQATIPAALEGKDILGTAQTGTGKTGAFGIPILASLYKHPGKVALILAPTRELAAQIQKVLHQMSKGSSLVSTLVVGGESFQRQARDLREGVDFIVATPGRLNDHLEQGTVSLSKVGYLVLDEADRMLDMGFLPQVHQIEKHLPKKRQTLLFAATLPTEVMALTKTLLRNPVRVAIGQTSQPIAQVKQQTIRTTIECKTNVILKEMETRAGRILIFTRTKSRAERLARLFNNKGHKVVHLHGGRSQHQRKQALDRFRNGSHRIMVATDLAGRGIDVVDIEHVINFDVPATRDDYIHRIGRTGRCGKTGFALNLLTAQDRGGEQIISGRNLASGQAHV